MRPHEPTANARDSQTLAKYKVLSAPLLMGPAVNSGDAEVAPLDKDGEPREYLGIVDVQDLLFSLLAEISRDSSPPPRSEAEWKKTLQDVQVRAQRRASSWAKSASRKRRKSVTHCCRHPSLTPQGPFLGRQLFLAAGHGDGDEVFKSLFSTSLLEAVVAGGMSGGVGPLTYVREGHERASDHPQSPGAAKASSLRPRVNHRLAILDGNGAVTDVFSQSDLVRFINKHADRLGPLAQASLTELGLGCSSGLGSGRGLVCVTDCTPAIEAFFKMRKEGVSALAVLSGEGALSGCLSPSDLRGLTEATLPLLALPCGQFVQRMREYRGEPDLAGGAVQCPPTACFGEVIAQLCQRRVHRVFVVEEAARPVGVVTLTDVIRVVVSPESALIGLPDGCAGSVQPLVLSA